MYLLILKDSFVYAVFEKLYKTKIGKISKNVVFQNTVLNFLEVGCI